MAQPGYKAHLASDYWRDLRRRAWRRAGGKCEACGNRPCAELHHLTYERFGAELLEDVEFLCLDCHVTRHGGKKRVKKEGAAKWAEFEMSSRNGLKKAARRRFGRSGARPFGVG